MDGFLPAIRIPASRQLNGGGYLCLSDAEREAEKSKPVTTGVWYWAIYEGDVHFDLGRSGKPHQTRDAAEWDAYNFILNNFSGENIQYIVAKIPDFDAFFENDLSFVEQYDIREVSTYSAHDHLVTHYEDRRAG